MVMVVVVPIALKPTKTRAERIAQCAICDVGTRRRGALTLNMVVVTFLNRADFGLKAEHLRAIFAQDACGRRNSPERRVPFASL